MSTEHQQDGSQPRGGPSNGRGGSGPPPIPGGVLAIILAMLAVALVLGYLFVNKLAAISQQEDCVLAHRHDC